MSVRPYTDLRNQAAYNLVLLSGMDQLAPEDAAKFDLVIDALIEQLNADEIVFIGDKDEIDNAIFLPLARLLANEAGPSFGIPRDENVRMANEMMIKRITATQPTYSVLQIECF